MQRPLLTILILTLAACGSGEQEDFAVKVKRDVRAVSASLGSIRLADDTVAAFGDMKLQVSKSTDNEIVYAVPMSSYPNSKDAPATIRFKLEPTDAGATTVVHVTVDVPPIRVLMGEANKELSETKVEGELNKTLTNWAKDMAMGSSSRASTAKFSDLFAAVAVAGNHNFQSQVNAAKLGFVPRSRLSGGSENSTLAETSIGRDENRQLGDRTDSEESILASDSIETDAERSDQSS